MAMTAARRKNRTFARRRGPAVVATLALALLGGLVPSVRATTVADTVPSVTEAADTSSTTAGTGGDRASCLATAEGPNPLSAPFCLMGVDPSEEGAASASGDLDIESSEPAACQVPLVSDKCPTWTGTYDHGYSEVVTAQAVSPAGDRVYVSTVDGSSRYFGGGGGKGASVTAIAHDGGQQLWEVSFDDPQGDRAAPSALAVSPDGTQLYVTGMSFGTVESGWDFVTMAYNTANGDRLWTSRYGGTEDKSSDGAISVVLSGDGATLYVTGSSGVATVSGAGEDRRWHYNYDYATVAYRADSGQQLWVARYDAEGSNDQPMSVGVDAANSRVFVTGFSSLSGEITGLFAGNHYSPEDTNSYDYATLAYDASTGAQLWERRYGSQAGEDLARSLRVAQTPEGTRAFVTGSSWDEAGPSPDDEAGPFDLATLAYDEAGNQTWENRYSRPSTSSIDPSALAVSPDGERVYVTGTSRQTLMNFMRSDLWAYCFLIVTVCTDREGRDDYVTVAYQAAGGEGGKQVWDRVYDHLGRDSARDIAVSPDNKRIYVTGASEKTTEEERTLAGHFLVTDAATVAYDRDGNQVWVGRYDNPSGAIQTQGLTIDVAGPAGTGEGQPEQSVVVGTVISSLSGTHHGALSYDAHGPGPSVPTKAPSPRSDDRAGTAEGSFSLMSMAHSVDSSAGPAAPWDGTSQGEVFRYNSTSCGDPDAVAFSRLSPGSVSPSATVNNISTNLTSYNTLIPGSTSPGATRTHPFEFAATAPDAQGRSRLEGRITVVACSLVDEGGSATAKVDTRPDSELPRITFDFEATAERAATQEAPFEGTFKINPELSTEIYRDITGSGRIHGYLFCFIEGYTAGGCADGGPFGDVHYTMTGWYHDPTVPGARKVLFPPARPVDVAPPPRGGPGVVEGPFSLQHMIHGGTWDGTSGADGNFQVPYQEDGTFINAPDGGTARPTAEGKYQHGTMPCSGNAPVNNVSTNLTTYNSRLPGGAAPASARNQPFKFEVANGDHPRQRKMNGTIALDVCHRKGGPTSDGKPDSQREKINFEVSATSERVSGEEVRFEGTFRIVGGTGVYEGLTGYGRIHGYLFCFIPSLTGSKGGWCNEMGFRDGQYTMNGWYADPTVAELGVGPTKVAFAADSPRSGQYSDQVTPKATLQDAEGKAIAGAGIDFELKGAGGTRSWTATTDAQGAAAKPVTLDLVPGAYELVASYAGSDKRGPSSDKVAFTIAKEATATALSVEGQAPKRTLRARVADDDAQRVAGVPVQFYAGAKPIGTTTTDANGEATLVVPARYQGGPHRFGASFAGDDRYVGSSAEVQTQ